MTIPFFFDTSKRITKTINQNLMKNVVKIAWLLVMIVTLSCSSDDSSDSGEPIEFAGSWSGTFSGGDSGVWSAIINEDGTVTGDAFSSAAQESLPLNGTIATDGEFRATAGTAENGATFSGTFTVDVNLQLKVD